MSSWFTVEDDAAQERLVGAWNDAPTQNLETLAMILAVAKRQVIAYAPAPVGDEDIDADPLEDYVLAQKMHAENLWNAGRVSSAGEMGDGGYTFTPRPLDKTIKGIIRPVDGKPHVL